MPSDLDKVGTGHSGSIDHWGKEQPTSAECCHLERRQWTARAAVIPAICMLWSIRRNLPYVHAQPEAMNEPIPAQLVLTAGSPQGALRIGADEMGSHSAAQLRRLVMRYAPRQVPIQFQL